MTPSLIGQYVYAIAVIAVLLAALSWVVAQLARRRMLVVTGRRLVGVIESTQLTHQNWVSVVKVTDRYYLLGSGQGGVSLVSEIPPEAVEPWLEEQRRIAQQQTRTVRGLWQRVLRR
ncbi:MAG TPA: flagellar biosynthetic protein FliO [Candidatus Dormibacteraeota bacterium]|nr:flagellar biosynthetic protein FliO [Candidatus Dormibacteraeota bacterium]